MEKPILTRNTTLLQSPSKTDIIPSILLLLAGRAGVLGAFPFGTAFFAACFDKSTAYLGITVLYLALLSAGASDVAVKYMMASLIFWLFINLYKRGMKGIEAAACGASVFISGMASMFYSFTGPYDVFILLIESAISAIMYIIFSGARDVAYGRRRASTQEELLSIGAAIGVFILGFGKMEIPYGISIANIITVYAVLIASLNLNVSGAALMGLVIGFITGGRNAVVMMGAFGLSAVFGNFLKTMNRFGTAIGFLGGACAVLLYTGESAEIPYSVYDILIGAGLFVATPGFIQKRFSIFVGEGASVIALKDSERLRGYLADRLAKCAKAFRNLEETFSVASGRKSELTKALPEDIISETAGRVCHDCPKCSKCWEKDLEKTLDGMSELLYILEQKGGLEINMIPLSFRDRCMRAERLMYGLEHSYELFKIKLSRDAERLSGRDAISAQYHETAEMIDEISKDIEVDFCTEAEEEAVRVFEQMGITVYEISITEGKRLEAYMRLSDNSRISEAEAVLTDILCVNMGFDKEEYGGLSFVSRPRFSVEIGVKQISKEDECGDTVRVFGTDKYKLYCIICDGMGVGKKAAQQSSITAGLLQEFLEAGFSIRTAVELVNSSMCMKAEEDYFTTLDLMCIDLMNGSAEFYKIGGAQSMIYRQGSAETVFSAAFPVGAAPFTEVLPQIKRIEDGDVVLMASDGITESGEVKTEWLRNSIKTPFLSMQSMAEEIAAKALKRNGGEIMDDMSVITLKIVEN